MKNHQVVFEKMRTCISQIVVPFLLQFIPEIWGTAFQIDILNLLKDSSKDTGMVSLTLF